ncbi:glycosyltransferase family 2 protein [Acidipila sp. EB88]|uniref:glycosyltransferase family 2 protein n=1 Tax=Acidipila sp. EB88 TaxID=2305226 RepID=UPI000F5F538E|nr:glycosyltransferase family 2 protein [Acidipila sp. EB88]RRA47306.1 glycosyltransferase family 2 protein [Acidipila sp. EB88]
MTPLPDAATPPRETISIAIVAKDEETNLRRVLPTVASWADEIVLIDSGSTDGTIALAQSFGARVLHVPWPGYGVQVNNALRAATSQWVFSLDADELFTPELATEVQALLARAARGEAPLDAYWVPRCNYFLGRAMRHGGFYPDRKLRLFRRGSAWAREDTEPHATPKYDGPAGSLTSDLLHDAYPTLALYLEHMNRYSSASVPLVLGRGKQSRSLVAFMWNVVLNPVATFLYNYGLRGGFLDGREGLLLHGYHSCYVSWKFAKAWEQDRAGRARSSAG